MVDSKSLQRGSLDGGGEDGDVLKDTPAKPEYMAAELHDNLVELLELCKSKNVEVPNELQAALNKILQETAQDAGLRDASPDDSPDPPGMTPFNERITSEREELKQKFADNPIIKQAVEVLAKLKMKKLKPSIKVKDGSFMVTEYFDPSLPEREKPRIATVYNEGPVGKVSEKLKRIWRTKRLCHKMSTKKKYVMKNVNLYFESGKQYLVLGAPRSGKSTLLKMIAGMIQEDCDHTVGGTVSMNKFDSKSKDIEWTNVVGYIDQIDRLHPFLTVKETCEFAWCCRTGGTHRNALVGEGEEVDREIERLDELMTNVMLNLEAYGLIRVADTFVGDQQTVRGVSGGEKKRVTVAEMSVGDFQVLCMDEISTGLDAATTYDICKLLSQATALKENARIVSLLQPPPETFQLFDELVLLSDGFVIYSGPIEYVVPYFESLGYSLPERMDVADWLQAIPTKDGAEFLSDKKDDAAETVILTAEQFSKRFYESDYGKRVFEKLGANEEVDVDDEKVKKWLNTKYRSSQLSSLRLLIQREMLLWWRNKTQIRARVMQDLVMGIVAGTLFWQSTDPTSYMGILFQSMFFVSIGALLKISPQYADRAILYKHQDANFFPTWTYVFGKSLASVPSSLIDGILYGTVIFWFVGLAFDDGASIGNYFMFMLLILSASVVIGLMFSIFPAITSDTSTGQACMSIATLLLVLFSGYTVQPNVIPDYWIWLYWFNTFAWALRGLAVNQFASGKYDGPSSVPGLTEGQAILTNFGFVDRDGVAYTFEWAWYAVIYCFGIAILSVIISSICLMKIRFATGKSLTNSMPDDEEEEYDEKSQIKIPFQKVDLTFKDIHYFVDSSVGKEKLELLKGVDGIVEAGKMTALMGSSGAGKTTLMDVLAMRKRSGEIQGEITLNGFPQEGESFRRAMGYVEQFDTQSAQLTIRETCMFSAKLRLDSSLAEVNPESIGAFVDQMLRMLELGSLQDLQIGSDASGGLSFEQRKRLSIAVELVANPSILFLDEPTSGLDARAASIVMRGLKRIAKSGKAVCATIHQPSIAIFNSFDALLLLKRGGEPIFFGKLGKNSKFLIKYLEQYEATPRIQPGENPATWMLTTIGAGSNSSATKPFDYAGHYRLSKLRKKCMKRIKEIVTSPQEEAKVTFPSMYATSTATQMREVMARARLIYWRSPSYNTVRIMVAAILALLIGSVYVQDRVPTDESDMNSRATTIFMAYVFIAVNSANTVLAVFEAERNMYYRHKEALMYDKKAVLLAFTISEAPFILISSLVYVSIFYFMIGFEADAAKFFMFWFFMFLSMANFTFLGQMFVSLTADSVTAQGFAGLLVTLSSLFTGVLIRPDNIPQFWVFMYWTVPGHYIFEGLLVSQFENDQTPIKASPNTAFWNGLNCDEQLAQSGTECFGSAEDWVFYSFGGNFVPENIPYNILYLVGLLFLTRVVTGLALAFLNYRKA